MKNKSLFAIILFIGLFGFSLFLPLSPASAHRPGWAEEAGVITIPDLETSYAYYRDLPEARVDIFTFEGKTGQNLYAGVQIPAIRGLDDYSVTMALFGPSLPKAGRETLPPGHPEDLGVLVFPSEISPDFFEPFTQTLYRGRQHIDLSLPADGVYYLLVWQPDGIAGKYVVDTGRLERFGPGDLFLFPIWWVRVHLFFGHGAYLLAGAGLITGLFILGLNRRRRMA